MNQRPAAAWLRSVLWLALALTCAGCEAERTHVYFYPPDNGDSGASYTPPCASCSPDQGYLFPLLNGGGGGK